MQAKSFLIINALIVLALVLRILLARKPGRPTALHIDNKTLPTDVLRDEKPQARPTSGEASSDEKSLNCYFTFNGMMLDAFEVLGVPGGSDKNACYRAYVDLRRQINKSSPELIEKAWEALQKHFER